MTIYQDILTEVSGNGLCRNRIDWEFKDANNESKLCVGNFKIETKYEINSKGHLNTYGIEHILQTDHIPKDVEGFIISVQRSLPNELFDPEEITIENLV